MIRIEERGLVMNKKERVYAVLKGELPDRIPGGFWMHFPPEAAFGSAAVKAHLDFFERSKTDICKVMTEHIYPYQDSIHSAKDWENVPYYAEDADFIQKQAEIIRSVAAQCPDAPVVATIHGVVASASHALLGCPMYDRIGRHAQIYHLRLEPEAVGGAYMRIAQTLCGMVRQAIKAGAEGIYYAALGGESDVFTDEEHSTFIAPADRMVIQAAYDAGAKFVILHMCKPKVRLTRFVDYPCDIVNWGIEESGISLAQGRTLFPGKVLLGGFSSHHGSLIDGDRTRITADIRQIIQEAGKHKLMFGSDCTLPGSLPYDKIAMVSDISAEMAME